MYNILGLFSSFNNTLWRIAILIGIVAIIVACIKNENGRVILFSLLGIGLIVYTSYCAVQLNYYYNEKGGIYGQLVSLYKPNQVVITDNVSYSFKNLALGQDGDCYSAKMISEEVLDLVLDDNASYGVYVNNMPCNYVEITHDYVLAKYHYVFYDDEFNVLVEDTLSLRFAFYTNSTYLSVISNGTSEDIKYWNNYFNKNIFEVTIDNKGYAYTKDITFGTGDVGDYSIVSYSVEDELYIKQVYKNGNVINLPISKYNWCLENGEQVANDFIITENVSLYAYPYTLTFNANGGTCDVISKSLYNTDLFGQLPTPTREGYTFAGWYTDEGVLVTSDTKMGSDDLTVYAHWTSPVYNVVCEYDVNTQTYVVSGTEHNDDTIITIPSTYDDGINGVALVTSISDNAFNGCTNITEVVIPTSITSIGSYAFYGCRSLTEVVLPKNLTSLGIGAFSTCNSLTNINIPQGITVIGDSVFYACGFTSITIPSHVIEIGRYAFNTCIYLEEVIFEDSSNLLVIGEGSFAECSKLASIVLPSTVTHIYSGAFYNCTNLTTMTILSVTPPNLVNTNAISSATTTIFIAGELDVYVNTNNWSAFTSKFVILE